MKNTSSPYQGSCLCGAIQYEVDKIEGQIGHCHCTMCRKFHGAALATYAEAKPENFRWVQGENHLVEYVGSNNTTRRFCKTCGSSMSFEPSYDNGGLIEFALGTLDTQIGHKPNAHIFVSSKAQWFDIEGDLPQHDEGRDD